MSKPLSIPSAAAAFTTRPTTIEEPKEPAPAPIQPEPIQPEPVATKTPRVKEPTVKPTTGPIERITMPLLGSDTDAIDELVAYLHRRRRRHGYRGRVSQATALRLALTVAHDLLKSDPEILETALPRIE